MRIVQLTDTHVTPPGRKRLYGGDPAVHLARAVTAVNALTPPPDVVLITGDLTDRGLPSEYRRVRALLEALVPRWYAIPGNHDDPESFRAAFADRVEIPRSGPIRYAIDEHPLRLVGCNSAPARDSGGMLSAESLAWLDACLSEAPRRPTLLFMHHPPFRTGVRYIDSFRFTGVDALGAVVRRHPQIVRIIGGHVHCVRSAAFHGTQATTSLSTAPQLVPEIFERRPLWLRREPPGFQLHRWDGTALATETYLIAPDGRAASSPAHAPSATPERMVGWSARGA